MGARLGWILLLLIGTGCADLRVVGDYARQSAQFTADTRLAQRYRDTYKREEPFLAPREEPQEQATDRKRQASVVELLAIQKGLTDYMNTLAKLAGEDTNDAVIDIGNLDTNLSNMVQYGVNSAHVEALAGLANAVARGLTSSRQKRAIEDMVTEADPHIQDLARRMVDLVQLCRQSSRNERAMVVNVLRVNIPYTRSGQAGGAEPAGTILVNRLARAQLQAREDEYSRAEAIFDQAGKGWATLAAGHRQLATGLRHLHGKALLQALRPMANDLRTLKNGL
jgi:hypothetical protein